MSDNLSNKLRRQLYAKKFTGYLILTAIGLVFVFFGYSGKNQVTGIGSVASVNNSMISVAEYQQEEQNVNQYYASLFGGQVDLGAQRSMLRQQALENLVQQELVLQAAQKAGILATDVEVRDFIVKSIPAFQENGQFQRDRYLGYLENTHTKPNVFEDKIRKNIETVRTHHLAELGTRPMDLEMQKIKELRDSKIDVAFVRLDADTVAKNLKISDSEINQKLADKEFLKKAQDRFAADKADWSKPELVTAQHILIATKKDDAASEAKALELAKSLKVRAEKEDFGKLAAKYSDDPGSKAKKGQLEAFSRGKMVKEFEDGAFAAKPGVVTEPVKTPYGYHLIKVSMHTQASEPTFDQVKTQVASKMIARERADEAMRGIDDQVGKGDTAAVDATLKSLNVAWDETGYFDLASDNVPKLPPGPVAEAAFEVSAQKPALNHVIHENGARFILRFKGAKTEMAKADDKSAEALGRRRAEGVYGSWMNQFRADSKIIVNQEAFR